jgi:diaminopimelate epimerase
LARLEQGGGVSQDRLSFVKMHGIGNDFVLIDLLGRGRDALERRDWPSLAREVCDRHFGVGADGILLVTEPDRESVESADYRMVMFNPDGSEAEMCGNGIRCFARYVYERSPSQPTTLRVQTGAGVLSLKVRAEGGRFSGVTVNMGRPRLEPSEIPVRAAGAPVIGLPLVVDGRELRLTCVSMGNPHAVAFVEEDVNGYPLEAIGPKVEHDPLFPRRVNFEICRVISRSELDVRVWERGAGITLACGTGAAATTVAARLNGLVDGRVRLRLPGGTLELEWDGEGDVYMTGPAELVFEGTWLR